MLGKPVRCVTQRVEAGFEIRSPRRLGPLPIRLQVLVQFPDLPPHLRDGRPVLVTVRDQPRQGPFRVNPAGRMHQDVVLLRTVAEDRQLRRHPMSDQTPQQRPLGGDPHVPRSR